MADPAQVVSQVNDFLNSNRESLISAMERTPDSLGLQSIFGIVAILMLLIVITHNNHAILCIDAIWV